MEIRILAIGRLGRGAEAELLADYLDRAVKTGRNLGISSVAIHEIDERKARDKKAQSEALLAALGSEVFWALDERGDLMTSPDFANALAHHRDQAMGRLNIIIGGADGLEKALRNEAVRKISFGRMVWPHMLARVMLSEQIYRGLSILAGNPYHRE